MWVILLAPLLVILLGVVIEVVHLWLARVELENGLESAALAAVKEWGDDNGASGTSIPRDIGVEFAQLNVINGIPIEIGPNLGVDATNNPNLNKLCDPQLSDMNLATMPRPDGNLIFGSIIENPDGTLVFDATQEPSCGCVCDVTVTVMGNQDELQNCGGWQVCFANCTGTYKVESITLELPPGAKNGAHLQNSGNNFECNLPMGVTASAVYDMVNNPPRTVTITYSSPLDPSLYQCGGTPLLFGLGINGFGNDNNCNGGGGGGGGGGNSNGNTADQIGQENMNVTIVFVDDNGNHETCSGVFEEGTQCDQISTATLGGNSGRDFGVRAQALVEVAPIFNQFSGIPFGPNYVCVVTTARYRCDTQQVELVRIEPENVICAPGNGADP